MISKEGSLWRKWDLHFHTPSSFDYQNLKRTNEEIINKLIESNIEVVAITDHHFIDTERINNLRLIAKDRITILPGIELRTELGGTESIHICAFFDEECDIEYVWNNLSVQLKLTRQDIKRRGGNEGVFVDLKDASKAIKEVGGIISIHAGRKSNSIEKISNKEYYKQLQKAEYLDKYVDLLEIGNKKDIDDYTKIVFKNINRILPLIIGSDNHEISQYNMKDLLWVKGNASFKTLQKVIINPEQRVTIGDIPRKVVTVTKNPTKYIKSISFLKRPEDTQYDEWFGEQEIPINNGLVSIIGNQGSGKSALVESIALLANSQNAEDFSFLTSTRFLSYGNNIGSNFAASLTWQDNSKNQKRLSDSVDESSVEMVRFIPQGLFEKICNEIGSSKTNFDKELEKVIFSHVPVSERLGKISFEDLVKYKVEEINASLEQEKIRLRSINEEIFKIEQKMTPEYKQKLESQLSEKKRELEGNKNNKPEEVPEPGTVKGINQVKEEIDSLQKEKDSLQNQVDELNRSLEEMQEKRAQIEKLKVKLSSLKKQIDEFIFTNTTIIESVGLQLSDLISYQISDNMLDAEHQRIVDHIEHVQNKVSLDNSNSLTSKIQENSEKINNAREKLDLPSKKYSRYLEDINSWSKKNDEIIGTESSVGSIKYIEKQINDIESLSITYREKCNDRNKVTENILRCKLDIVQVYKSLYSHVQNFIASHPIAQGKFNLQFDVSISVSDSFIEEFFEYILQNVAGEYLGRVNGQKRLRTLFEAYNFMSVQGMCGFIDGVLKSLTHGDNTDTSLLDSQLAKGKTRVSFYNFLFSLDYLEPTYTLKYGDKELKVLSPGERGALLLIFYLLIDKDDIPLIVDQPEGNLDNQSVYKILVECIKEAKLRRQIIVVTHNPNLAVGCDSEQIIWCEKSERNKITYLSGALEDPSINRKVVDILEGTKPAFENREFNYKIHEM